MDITDIWIKYKKTILIVGANVIGLVVIICFYYLVMGMAAGPVPKPEIAPPKEIVQFMADSRFKMQSDPVKLDFAQRLVTYYANNPSRIEQAAQYVDNLNSYQAQQLRENVMDMFQLQVVADAEQYNRLTDRQSRENFIKERFSQGKALRAMITGRGSVNGGGVYNSGGSGGGGGGRKRPNIAASPKLTAGMPSDGAGMYKMMVQQTSPGKRAKMENYVQDVKTYADKVKARGE